MLSIEGTVVRLRESDEKHNSDGEVFTTWAVEVFDGGEFSRYLDLPKGFDRTSIPAPGQPIRAAVGVRAYPSPKSRYGAGYSLTLRALLPVIGSVMAGARPLEPGTAEDDAPVWRAV